MLDKDKLSCTSFFQSGAAESAIKMLNSANDYNRIEAMHIVVNLSHFKETCTDVFKKYNLLTRMIVLIEEGLQLQSDFGYNLASLAL